VVGVEAVGGSRFHAAERVLSGSALVPAAESLPPEGSTQISAAAIAGVPIRHAAMKARTRVVNKGLFCIPGFIFSSNTFIVK
jgi:hypothetical protein